MMLLGIDLGSVSSQAVLLDEHHGVRRRCEVLNRGQVQETLEEVVGNVLDGCQAPALRVGITGCGRDASRLHPHIYAGNELVALSIGGSHESPEALSIIEIGGQTSSWMSIDPLSSSPESVEIRDFSLNTRCAAGSGAFLEQQAARLKLTITEFAECADAAQKGATIAGRCSVFAKSDMIHLQQKGTPLEEIAYGLCQALARNYVATILKGRENKLPVLLTGGGFQNRGLVRAFREVLSLQDGTFVLSQAPSFTSALGAALAAHQNPHPLTVDEIRAWLSETLSREGRVRCFLPSLGEAAPAPPEEPQPEEGEFVRGYLGVDVGSVSTNLALVDGEGRLKAGIYLPTKGRPLEVIREGCEQLFDRCSGGLEILGIGTTGSGRHLAGEYLEADEVRNEITCQLAGTLPYFPEADTIFEIGGQDSKFIKLRNGRIQDFTMNKICAAGTGSFLEEQAELLDLDIKQDFSRLAHQSEAPSDLGSQCTVFMESELVNALSRGESVSDVTAGLAFAIARNYLEKVVAERTVGDHIVFQGGTASNPAVVNAFARLLKRPVPVHPYNRISGAIGAALITRRTVEQKGKTSPNLAQLQERIRRPCKVSSFQCRHCANQCQVNRIDLGNRQIFFGDICERYTAKQRTRRQDVGADEAQDRDMSVDLFAEWQVALQDSIRNPINPSHTVGIPRASLLMGDIPFWAAFFNHLGCKVLLSPPSDMDILNSGLKKISVETCLPVKLAYGHVQWFADREVDFVFIPSYVQHMSEDGHCEQNCPYAEHIPWMLWSTSEFSIESPQVNLAFDSGKFFKAMSSIQRRLGKTKDEFARALDFAHDRFKQFRIQIQMRGEEVLEQFRRSGSDVWVITGKPYNVHDPFVNLNLALHLKRMDVCIVPQDFIPEDIPDSTSGPGLPPWRYNQRMIAISQWCRGQVGTYPLVISNFGCGPDAFTQKHISQILRSTPHLWLEFDEHRAEAGLITRLEAFYDEISDGAALPAESPSASDRLAQKSPVELRTHKFVLPYFTDHVVAFAGALKSTGIDVAILPLPDEETLVCGSQHCSGKECHAYSIMAGDLVKYSRKKREDGEVFYFPGAEFVCLLSQYEAGLSFLLEDLGIRNLHVKAPPMSFLLDLLGMPGLMHFWGGLTAVDLLVKAAAEKRPYEKTPGDTDRVHGLNLMDIEEALEKHALSDALSRCVERLESIAVTDAGRPLIGIAGDIYTRQNPVANNHLFHKLEALGCEVWPAPFLVDSTDFGIHRRMKYKRDQGKWRETAVLRLLNLRKDLESRRIRHRLARTAQRLAEPGYKKNLSLSSPYIGESNNDLLLLNIAKMVDFAQRGADGIINAISLNCMLGTASAPIAARMRKDFDGLPIATIAFSGTDSPVEDSLLEAFVYQVRQRTSRKFGA